MNNDKTFIAPEGTEMPQEQVSQGNPFWYREQKNYLRSVTSAPVNQAIGVLEITLKPATENQKPHGYLFNGMLKVAVGSLSFQVRVSEKGGPFVTTVNTENGVDDKGKTKYWEHIVLSVQVKAQILRYTDMVMSGQAHLVAAQVQQQQPVYGGQPQFPGYPPQVQQFPGQMPYGGQPMYGAQPQFAGQPAYGMNPYADQGFGGQPAYGGQPQFPAQQAALPTYGAAQPTYTPPTPQGMAVGAGQPAGDALPESFNESDLPV